MTARAKKRSGRSGNPRWRKTFLEHLAESSNVRASAEKAGIDPSSAYRLRRENAEFARAWLAALWEGYVHLEMEVLRRLRDGDLQTEASDKYDFANGANRLCVGGEILQFANAVETASGHWELTGLLRGRGGTEDAALAGHTAGTPVALLDDRLTDLDPALFAPEANTRIAAIGRGDATPVFAQMENAGLSRRPPSPVHPRLSVSPADTWTFCWTRRARGHWRWDSLLELPLVEQQELYVVGFGPVTTPHRTWSVAAASLALDAAERADLLAAHGSGPIWVRQVGTFSNSLPLFLADID